jgi:hypothetical protein
MPDSGARSWIKLAGSRHGDRVSAAPEEKIMASEFDRLVDADNGLVNHRVFIEPEIMRWQDHVADNAERPVILEVR